MQTEPHILQGARAMVAAHRRSDGREPGRNALAETRARLRSFASHPSTGEDLRQRVLGVLVVVDVIVRSLPAEQPQRLAG